MHVDSESCSRNRERKLEAWGGTTNKVPPFTPQLSRNVLRAGPRQPSVGQAAATQSSGEGVESVVLQNMRESVEDREQSHDAMCRADNSLRPQ